MKTMGNKIRELRRRKGVSQSEMANEFGITAQAVSKWESDTSYPDISLLPDIAIFLGVSIDELFEYTKDKKYNQIDNMIEMGYMIKGKEFIEFEEFLVSEVEQDNKNYRAANLLGKLYSYYADCMNKKAILYADKALMIKPNSKNDLAIINKAYGARGFDWNSNNHNELIEYWYKLVKIAPENTSAYLYLLDSLIHDKRLKEARTVLEQVRKVKPNDTIYMAYEIWIDEQELGFVAVKDRYDSLAKEYKDDWRVLFHVANAYSLNGYYKDAIEYWLKVHEVKEKPRYGDFYDAIAQCYLYMGDKEQAIKYLKKEKQLLKEEWGVMYGMELDNIEERIKKLV